MKVGCKGLTGIEQTVVLWNGGDSSDVQVKVWDIEFCIKHAVLLPSDGVYLMTNNKEFVV